MNFKRFHESKNLFDYSTITTGYRIQWATGNDYADATAVRSDYIPVNAGTYSCSDNVIVLGYDTNKNYLGATDGNGVFEKIAKNPISHFTILANSDCKYIKILSFYNGQTPMNIDSETMLNTGSTALPYEPYFSEVWHDTPYYIHNTATDTLTTLPAVIYANDTTATVGLKGNTVQTGTPTPDNPIMPQETGEMTGNLFPLDESRLHVGRIENDGTIDYEIGTLTVETDSVTYGANATWRGFYTDFIQANENEQLTFSPNDSSSISWACACYDENGNFLGKASAQSTASTRTFTLLTGTKKVRLSVTSSNTTYTILRPMLSLGSTVLPYEPYGQYKIPILNNSQTTNVYLGEVQSTRRIKKLVLTGEEDIEIKSGNAKWYIPIADMRTPANIGVIAWYCSHYQAVANNASWTSYDYMISWSSADIGADRGLRIRDINFLSSSLADFKAYLAQQYSAGTPVCVWYVLANPETAVVNEPLRKIGTYADEVSGITIPTIAGANTISVDTTLQPSEVTATYKGWHPVTDVHVYPDSSWMPTSWEEFRKAVRSGKAQSLYPVGTKLYENWGDTTSDAWIVVDYPTGEDYLDSDLAQQGYTNRVMLMEEKLNYLRQFDAIEAWLYVETAIPAGTYRFTIPNYDATYGGNKTYILTSTANVPVGGQLTLTWAYQRNPSAVQAYSSATSTSALFNVSITEWDGTTACTDLGTIKLAQNDADSTYGKLNHIHRARYGSNNYYQSGYRQWLNTNASANWWTPTNVFDRPYGNRTNAGRLNVMNSNMKSVLATPTVNCITNNLFEYPSLDGTTFSLQTAYTVKDKLFPVTHSEINLSSSPNVNSVLDYYVGKGNADRIKYRKDNGNAYYWWLRTPYPTYASYVRNVNTSGALYSSFAYNPYGSAAACIIQ